LRNQNEADLLTKVRQGSRFPFGPLSRWRCFPVRELEDDKKHRPLWEGAREGWPLWKGESFDQYDPNGAEARICPPSDAVWKRANKARPGGDSVLASELPVDTRQRAVASELGRERVAFRDVSRADDSRTVRACVIPPETFLTNTGPYLAFAAGGDTARAACVGVMNSLPFDWQARRFVEKHLNYFVLEGLVVPDLDDEDYAEIARCAARLSCVDDRFTRFAASLGVKPGPLREDERDRLRVEIDARVARGWRLSVADIGVMFTDFAQDAVPPAYRQLVRDRLGELVG
jgi:hypothetical protein